MSWKPASWPGKHRVDRDRLGHDRRFVAAYVAAFFNHRPTGNITHLIVARLFAASWNRPYDFFDQGLKIIGYVGGSQSLSAVLGTVRSESTDRLKTLQQEASRLIIVWRAYEELVTAGKLTPRQLREFLTLLKDRDIVGERENEYAANVKQMLMGMRLAFLDRADALRLQKREGRGSSHALRANGPKTNCRGALRVRLELRTPREVQPPRHVAEDSDAPLIAPAEPQVQGLWEEDPFS